MQESEVDMADDETEAEKRLADLKEKYRHLLQVISLRGNLRLSRPIFAGPKLSLVLACYWAHRVGHYPC